LFGNCRIFKPVSADTRHQYNIILLLLYYDAVFSKLYYKTCIGTRGFQHSCGLRIIIFLMPAIYIMCTVRAFIIIYKILYYYTPDDGDGDDGATFIDLFWRPLAPRCVGATNRWRPETEILEFRGEYEEENKEKYYYYDEHCTLKAYYNIDIFQCICTHFGGNNTKSRVLTI